MVQSKRTRGGNAIPQPNYICNRCKERGHFIDNCPTNGDPNFDSTKPKRTTGIPQSFLKPVDSGGMVNYDGQLVEYQPNEYFFFIFFSSFI